MPLKVFHRAARLRHYVVTTSGCWEWSRSRTAAGYGKMTRDGRGGWMLAHRASYEHFVGPIPQGLVVMHMCDNPPCINPEHLRVGTTAENLADMRAKGRWRNGSSA